MAISNETQCDQMHNSINGDFVLNSIVPVECVMCDALFLILFGYYKTKLKKDKKCTCIWYNIQLILKE